MMQDSLNVENTPECHHREHVSGTTQASFLAKLKATQNKLGQKRQHHSVCIHIYIYIYVYTQTSNKRCVFCFTFIV